MTQADEGLSGTNTKKRKAFNQMISDAQVKLFDLVLTKEISRFARNTLDSIYYTRLLKSKNIGVYFINDNINTLDPDSELRMTIMASIAQEESRKTSDRVKWGQKRSMEKGVVFGTRVYGYYLKDGKLAINEEKAEIIRLIYFKYFNEGKGVNIVARELDLLGIPTPTGIKHWTHATLLRILKNEKYIGILKQKKEITTDYLNHTRKRNEGEEEFIVIEDNHPAIIEKNLFYNVQDEIKKRQKYKFEKTKYSNRYCFSGKLVCGYCGSRFKRRINNAKAINSQIVWECGISVRHGKEKINEAGHKIGCNNKSIAEKLLESKFMQVLDDFIENKQQIIESLEHTLKKVLSQNEDDIIETNKLNVVIERVQAKKKKLVELYMDNLISKEEFHSTSKDIASQIESHQSEIEKAAAIHNQQKDFDTILKNIHTNIENIVNMQEFSEEVCKSVLDKVIIHGRDHMEVIISGTSVKKNSDIPLSETQYPQQKEQSSLP